MPQPSFIKQQSGSAIQAVPVQWPMDHDTFQLFDPPSRKRSPNTPTSVRDTAVTRVRASTTTPGTTDTRFEVLVGDPDSDVGMVDALGGDGVIPANVSEVEWYLVPSMPVTRGLTRRALNPTVLGTGMRGLVVEIYYE